MPTAKLPWPPRLEPRSTAYLPGSYTLNACFEKDGNGDVWVIKRDGYQIQTDYASAGYGFYQDQNNSTYAVTYAALRYNGINILNSPDPTDIYWFNQTNGVPNYTYLSNGAVGYSVAAGVATQITDAVYTGTIGVTVPGSAFLDGTLYVMNQKAQIYGSKNLNNPTVWDALNVITAQDTPGLGVALAKHLVYVVAFKDKSVEFFYDAGAYAGTTTGSPLLPTQQYKLDYGCYSGHSVTDVEGTLYWVGCTQSGQPNVMRLQGLKPERISTPDVERFLLGISGSALNGYWYKSEGHNYYVIAPFLVTTLPTHSVRVLTPTPGCLAYDIATGEWSYTTNTAFFHGMYGGTPGSTGKQYGLTTAGQLCYTQDGTPVYLDSTSPITTTLTTLPYDGGTQKVKVLSKLYILADWYEAGALQVRWSDDDYKTWSQWVTVPLNQNRPMLTNLGSFRRRAFQFQHTSNSPFRMKGAEMDLLLGDR